MDLLTIKICIFEKIRMDCNLGDEIRVVRNPTSALVGVIILRAPGIRFSGGSVELASTEEVQVTMVEPVERDIHRTNSINI